MRARLRVVNASRGRVLGNRVRVANRWWSRLRGLLGVRELAAGEGLLISPCEAVHTVGMRFAVDVAFLDGAGRVVEVYPAFPPNRFTRWHRGAAHALELPPGSLGDTRAGDALEWEEAGEPS